MADVDELNACPDCASVNTVRAEKVGQMTCMDCGLLFEPIENVLAPVAGKKSAVKAAKAKRRK
jgi:transcription initiation factor TFIIIB Brf1 subunit/transcription initiation factor TFIIB